MLILNKYHVFKTHILKHTSFHNSLPKRSLYIERECVFIRKRNLTSKIGYLDRK